MTIDADFAKYDSFEQSITAHAGFFIRNKRYAKALQCTGKPDEFCREIRKAGYATDPDYADTLIAFTSLKPAVHIGAPHNRPTARIIPRIIWGENRAQVRSEPETGSPRRRLN